MDIETIASHKSASITCVNVERLFSVFKQNIRRWHSWFLDELFVFVSVWKTLLYYIWNSIFTVQKKFCHCTKIRPFLSRINRHKEKNIIQFLSFEKFLTVWFYRQILFYFSEKLKRLNWRKKRKTFLRLAR